jgi:hypothetical protein
MIMQSILKWPKGPVYLLMIALLLFLIPSRFEGPLLFEIIDEHGLSITDLFAMIPLLASVTWIQRGLWKRRIYLFNRVTLYPGATTLIIFFMGLGLGMVIASAFFNFHYWWAVGGVFFIFFLVVVVLKSGKSDIEE